MKKGCRYPTKYVPALKKSCRNKTPGYSFQCYQIRT